MEITVPGECRLKQMTATGLRFPSCLTISGTPYDQSLYYVLLLGYVRLIMCRREHALRKRTTENRTIHTAVVHRTARMIRRGDPRSQFALLFTRTIVQTERLRDTCSAFLYNRHDEQNKEQYTSSTVPIWTLFLLELRRLGKGQISMQFAKYRKSGNISRPIEKTNYRKSGGTDVLAF